MKNTGAHYVMAEPDAGTMIETFRSIGYSIETAIADIVDNSISAGAMNVWIDFNWAGPGTVLSIMDDGKGMGSEEIIEAMRPGSINPLATRSGDDLGRFGLGLKTASFSQCRKFCVRSRKNGDGKDFWSWDLDHVNKVKAWQLVRQRPESDFSAERFNSLEQGTEVLWWDIDRLIQGAGEDDTRSKDHFNAVMVMVKAHLGMVFQRFLDDNLTIYMRDKKVESWDPFMTGFQGTQVRPEQYLENGQVRLKGFVLPHRSRLEPEAYEYGKGPKGNWSAHQGFYVYRNRRLLVAGDWLGLFKREIHYDLCRIRIDLPNTLDHEWQIDIKKSIARPPARLLDEILAFAKDVRAQAIEVYRHRGKVIRKKLAVQEFHPLWEEKVKLGKRFYRINRTHPLVKDMLVSCGSARKQVEGVLQMLEEMVPVPLMTLRENENERPLGQPYESTGNAVLKEAMLLMYQNMLTDRISPDIAKARIAGIEPFNLYPEYLEDL
ncbi:MAG: ATP-binding protein [Chlorobium sp.]|uniref:ATP-binding protein n=1 Tax=Chlorobium sp. TaxID=1095 RepID=UPI0025C4C3A1|nr:ATP-binding protein [Chlorobium sp.]MCF8217085.1 ATP-binding protein [Chlorobium sp.]MCF8271931.1 ATP-binding protein [Chlorobium sp.]MCF8288302.1 ATP-binding protein [Chlorobium sp.]MCF8291894.1 ATP-binding protein [Chlorobium sp.]MCF8386001.1 ATP-binding protein [Chlorobium sp.]